MTNTLSSHSLRGIILACLFGVVLPLQSQPLQFGALHGALVDASVGLPLSGWGPNPANLGYQRAGVVSFYAAQAYTLSELSYGGTHISIPIHSGIFLLHASNIGVTSYQETQFHAGFAGPLHFGTTRKVMVAAQGTLKRVAIKGYGNSNNYALTLGTSVQLAPSLFLGAAALNYFQTQNKAALPKTLMLGIAYQPIAGVWLMSSIVQEQSFSPSIKMGIEGHIKKILILRYGFSSNPVKFAVGAGIQLQRLFLNLAAERHFFLGWTPGLAINLTFKRRKDV